MTADTVPQLGNLPAEPNSFVGRERDLSDLALLLGSVRVLTLCGPGGIGKTRLAVRLGWQLSDEFPDGVWLAELAELTDPGLVARQVATVLGIGQEPGQPLEVTLADALRARQLLLILDTCEHVIEAVADLVHELAAACPQLRLVTTSREPLRVRGETVWRVPPLSLPGLVPPVPAQPAAGQNPIQDAPGDVPGDVPGQPEAVRLFVARAAAVRPGFAITPDNHGHVVRLCRALDGVPLAIELAAARIRALSVEQIAARIHDRFRLLASGDRTAPPRQQTLLAAVEWSYGLLTADEQILLRRLAVFSGWSLEMAERVCSDEQIAPEQVLGLLAALIDKSLVALDEEVGGDARYRLLDTIREYAATRLAAAGEATTFRRRHRDFLLSLVEDVTASAFSPAAPPWPEQVRLYRRVAAEQANLRTALSYCQEIADAAAGLRLCSALRSPWVVQGDVTEGLAWFATFLGLDARVPARVRIRALMLGAELAFENQDYPTARQHASAALAAGPFCPDACVAGAFRLLALISLRAGEAAAALARADAAVAAAREHADQWEEGLALTARAAILVRAGEPEGAEASFTAALGLLSASNGWGVASVLTGLGGLARARGETDAALQHFRSALALFREIGARTEIARCLAGIGWLSLTAGDLDAAADNMAESLDLSVAAGQRLAIARGLEAVAALAVARGDYLGALRFDGASAALRAALAPAPSSRPGGDAILAAVRPHLPAAEVADAIAEGSRLSTHEAARLALAFARGQGERVPEVQPLAGEQRAPGPHSGQPPAGGRQAPQPPAGGRQAPQPPAGGQEPEAAGQAERDADDQASPAARRPVCVLTAREREVALLVARGLSNRAIAVELFISPATAARHVANILGKLGLSSRAQIAAWTADRLAAGGFGTGLHQAPPG